MKYFTDFYVFNESISKKAKKRNFLEAIFWPAIKFTPNLASIGLTLFCIWTNKRTSWHTSQIYVVFRSSQLMIYDFLPYNLYLRFFSLVVNLLTFFNILNRSSVSLSHNSLYSWTLYLDSLYLRAMYHDYLYSWTLYLDCLYLWAMYHDYLYSWTLYLDSLYLWAMYHDYLHLWTLYLASLYLWAMYYDHLYSWTLYLDSLYLWAMYYDNLYSWTLYLDSLYLWAMYHDYLYLWTLYLDSLYLRAIIMIIFSHELCILHLCIH